MRPFSIELSYEGIEAVLLLQTVEARRGVASFLSVRCMRSCRPFCCGWPGLMRSIAMPSRSHQTESFERLNRALGLAKGTPLSERMASGKPRSREQPLKGRNGCVFAGRIERFAQQQEA